MLSKLTFGAAALIAVAILGGCAAPAPVEEAKPLVWPPAPLEARIRFVRNITSEKDLKADSTFGAGLAAFLTGEKLPEGRIGQPMGIAVSDDGDRIYVSDPMQRAVHKFDFRNRVFAKVTDVMVPAAIALDDQENLYVVDTGKKSVSVFGRDGKEITTIGDESIIRPTGLAIDRQRGKLYVVDTGTQSATEHTVKVFDLQGKRIGTVGKGRGGEFGQFNFPTFATVDAQGNLYVSDTLNSRVQKFDPEGRFLHSFGKLGTAWGDFDKPKGVAVDSFGNVYVADSGWSNVQIFNQKGQILLFFGGRGPIPGMMKNPLALAIDKQNRIYVGDHLNHRVGVYELVNTKATDSYITPPAANPPGR